MQPYRSIKNIYQRDETGKHVLTGIFSEPAFAYLAHNEWIFTEKVDGTNIRIIWDGTKVEYRGRSDDATTDPRLLRALEAILPSAKLEAHFGHTRTTLYGEGYGAKINGGGKYRAD